MLYRAIIHACAVIEQDLCTKPKHVLNVPTDLQDPEDWLVSDKDKEVGGKSTIYGNIQMIIPFEGFSIELLSYTTLCLFPHL